MLQRSTKGIRPRPRLALAVVAVVGLLLGACDPIPHPSVVVRESSTSPVTFELLAARGRYVVVTATGSSATVPGPGVWRVDRIGGATVLLPGSRAPRRISADGRRILLADGTLWTSGTISTPPPGSVFSPDLTAIAYLGPDGTILSQRLSDGTVWSVEDGLPRPPGYGASSAAVSDDGRTVQLRLVGYPPLVRFVDLDAATAVDRQDRSSYGDFVYEKDWFALAADGSRFAHHHEQGEFVPSTGSTTIAESWVELVDVDTGTAVTHWDSPNNAPSRTLDIGGFGREAWLYQEQTSLQPGGCPGAPGNEVCVTSSTVVAIEPQRAHQFSLPVGRVGAVNMSRNGRFLLVTNDRLPFANASVVTVLDWLSNTKEQLVSPESYVETVPIRCLVAGFFTTPCTVGTFSANAQITDDGRLIASRAGSRWFPHDAGWYELSATS